MIHLLFINLTWWQFSLIAIEHWLQDRTPIIVWTMKVTGKGDLIKTPMAPWSIIVTDNIWHLVWIYAVTQMGTFF